MALHALLRIVPLFTNTFQCLHCQIPLSKSIFKVLFFQFRFKTILRKRKALLAANLLVKSPTAKLEKSKQTRAGFELYSNILFQQAIEVFNFILCREMTTKAQKLQLKFRYKHFQFYVPIFRLLSVKFQSNF
jgi:hypothetical protein